MDKDKIAEKIFWYIVGNTVVGVVFMFCIVFLHIPKENSPNVNLTFGFMAGQLMGASINFLLGGNPTDKKKGDTTIQQSDNTNINTPAA